MAKQSSKPTGLPDMRIAPVRAARVELGDVYLDGSGAVIVDSDTNKDDLQIPLKVRWNTI